MKKLLKYGNLYAEQSDWKDFALIKSCLFCMGIMVGVHVSKEKKDIVFPCAFFVFIITYIPLMAKLFRIIAESKEV